MNSRDKYEDQKGQVDDCEGEEKDKRCVVLPRPDRLKIPVVDMTAHLGLRQIIDPKRFRPAAETMEQLKQQ